MLPRLLVAATVAVAMLAVVPATSAQESPEIVVSAAESALVGEHFAVIIEVRTGPDVVVEIDPVAATWAGVEVLAVAADGSRPAGNEVVHRFEVTATSFRLGSAVVQPRVLLIADGIVTGYEGPGFTLEIVPSLPPGAALDLTSLPMPQAVAGPGRNWERPLAASAVAIATLSFAGILVWLARHRPRRALRVAHEGVNGSAAPAIDLPDDEDALADPVAAYRRMGTTVRRVLAEHYNLPAVALTTGELGRRMESEGVDRWKARLVRGLLENCDAVIYAGYRPADDRRRADLNIAREIVEGLA